MTEDTRHEIIVENLACLISEKGDLPKSKRESVYLLSQVCFRARNFFSFFFLEISFFFFSTKAKPLTVLHCQETLTLPFLPLIRPLEKD